MHPSRGARRAARLLTGAALTVVAAVVLSFAAVLTGLWSPFATETVDRSAPVVLHELQDISRYRAATGQFSELVDVEDDVKHLPDFLAGERTVLVAVGTVDAEVDFGRLDASHIVVSPDGRSVEIHLPPAELREPQLDMGRTHVATRSRGLANRVSEALTSNAQDDAALYQRAQQQIAGAAAGTELRARAEENTRTMLTGLLRGLGYEQVTVSFDAPTV